MATVNKDFIARNGIQGTVLKSTIATGTAPLQVTSTTAVTNLNADLLDGNHASAFGLVSGNLGQFGATTSAQLAGVISDETGSGSLVFANTPTLVTPVLGVATATSINKVAFTAPATSATLTLANGSTLATSGAFSITLTSTAATNVTLPTSGTLATTSNNLGAFASTTSSQLAGVISDETGSGALVFGTSPAITTSLTTPSTTFALVNTTATTVNFAGAATTLSIGAATGTTTVNNSLTVGGNLVVNGTTTTVNSTITTYDDPIITLGGDTAPTSDDNKDRGVEFRWHNGTAAKIGFFGFDDSTGKFTFIPDATNSSEVFSGTKGSIDAYHSGSDINEGTVATSYGGTGLTSFTSGGAVYATSTSALTTGTLPVTAGGTGVATLTAGYVKSNGTSAFTSVTSIPGSDVSGAISGNAGGLVMTNGDVTSKNVTVNTNSTPTNLDSFAVATYTTAKYLIQMKQGTKMTSTELVVSYDGTDVQVSEYGVIDATAGAANATITATYSAPNVLVTVSSSDAATTNVVCKAIVQYIDA